MRALWRRAAIATTTLALIFLLGLLAAPGAEAWTFILLHTFIGTHGDGADPQAGLIMDAAGNLYGTATNGGSTASQNCPTGCGTVFKLAAVTFVDLTNLVQQFTDLGAKNVLVTESKMAEAAFKNGNQKAVNRMLNTFIRQVSAMHSRKALTAAQAATLVQEAKDLMS
jgi:hypothetical protein